MLQTSPHFISATMAAVVRGLSLADHKVIGILVAVALLSACQVKSPGTSGRINHLIQQLQSEDIFIRTDVAVELPRIGRDAVPALITVLKEDQPEDVRVSASVALQRIGRDAIPLLIIALKDQDAGIGKNAASVLGFMGRDALPTLITALKDQDAGIRRNAADGLWRALPLVGPNGRDAAPALITALKVDPDAEVRSFAARALGIIKPEVQDTAPVLMTAFKDRDARVRSSAAATLGIYGSVAVPVLIAALQYPDADIRSLAAFDLSNIQSEAKDVVPALVAALQDSDAAGRRAAARGLKLIAQRLFDTGNTGSLVQLKAAYDALMLHPDSDVRRCAISIKQTIDYMESPWWAKAGAQISQVISSRPYLSATIGLLLVLSLAWLFFLWLRRIRRIV